MSIAIILASPGTLYAESGFAPPRHSAAQKVAARRDYSDCLVGAAARTDDGRSDPGAVAQTMRGICIEQQFRMALAVADGARQSYLILSGIDAYRSDASRAVLLLRSATGAAGSIGHGTP